MSENADLEELRKQLTSLTIEILRLCSRRFQLARKIARVKARGTMLVEDPRVESDLRKKVSEACQRYGINLDFGLTLLNTLLKESKRVQREVFKSQSRKENSTEDQI